MSWVGAAQPLVSVICGTYNHVNYISYCLEGVLRQQTDFPFEILIHDDASTDGTRNIVRAYAQRYPGLVRATIQTENQFSKGVNPRYMLSRHAAGQFIAFCDGDDRWTDVHKLQQQVSFLQRHPEHVLSFHRASYIDAENRTTEASVFQEECWRDYTRNQMRSGEYGFLPLPTLVHRKVDLVLPREFGRVVNSDSFLPMLLSQFGSAGFQPEITPSQIRIHPTSICSSKPRLTRAAIAANNHWMMARYLAGAREFRPAIRVLRRGAVIVRRQLREEITSHILGSGG